MNGRHKGRAPVLACIAAATLAFSVGAAPAADALKATIGQRGNWDSAVVHLGTKAGIFQKHGLYPHLNVYDNLA